MKPPMPDVSLSIAEWEGDTWTAPAASDEKAPRQKRRPCDLVVLQLLTLPTSPTCTLYHGNFENIENGVLIALARSWPSPKSVAKPIRCTFYRRFDRLFCGSDPRANARAGIRVVQEDDGEGMSFHSQSGGHSP